MYTEEPIDWAALTSGWDVREYGRHSETRALDFPAVDVWEVLGRENYFPNRLVSHAKKEAA